MDTALMTTTVSTSGAVITGIFGMFFTANQLGKRIEEAVSRDTRNHNRPAIKGTESVDWLK